MLTKDILKITESIHYNSIFSGADSLQFCHNKEHFKNYKKRITYRYNSRGFRDAEWPENLSDSIWCVGDSFTVGIGQPFEETWPQLLEKKIGKRCINLGEDGCSNDTISLRVKEIYKLYQPKLVIVMWSYFSRRRIDNKNVQFDKNDFGVKNDIENFGKNFSLCQRLHVNLIHFTIPNVFEDMNYLKEKYPDVKILKKLDYARDYYHFDIKTSEYVCDEVIKNINEFDKSSK